ncbi:conserved hypothetical protein [Micrococcus luteus]|nr:conserved hypothetical protein [Micrococcus luteus]
MRSSSPGGGRRRVTRTCARGEPRYRLVTPTRTTEGSTRARSYSDSTASQSRNASSPTVATASAASVNRSRGTWRWRYTPWASLRRTPRWASLRTSTAGTPASSASVVAMTPWFPAATSHRSSRYVTGSPPHLWCHNRTGIGTVVTRRPLVGRAGSPLSAGALRAGGPRGLGRGGARALGGHPALDGALRHGVQRQGAGRDVVADHRAGTGVGAVAHRDRGREHRVRAGAHVGPDHGAVLGDAVVVGGDVAAADVGVLADLGVPGVAQVGELGAAAHGHVLGLVERADLAVLPQHRARAQVGERADGRARADHGLRGVGALHHGALPHLRVREGGVRADDGARGHRRRPMQLGAGLERDVRGEGDGDVHPRGGRVDDRDTLLHPAAQHAVVELAAQVGELTAVIGALDLPHVVRAHRGDAAALGAGHAEHVREVLLALHVVRGDLRQGAAQQGRVEGVDAGVDLADRHEGVVPRGLGMGEGVLVLHDPLHEALGVADDAAVARGVLEGGGEHGDGVAVRLVVRDEPGEGLRGQQRDVTVGHHDGALEVRGQGGQAQLDGAAGARHVVLVGDRQRVDTQLGRNRLDVLGHAGPLVPDHGHEVLRRERPGRRERVAHEGAPPDRVHDLRRRRLHAGALARGQDDHGGGTGGRLGHGGSCTGGGQRTGVPPLGFEPRPHGSKGRRAAITPGRSAGPQGAATTAHSSTQVARIRGQ